MIPKLTILLHKNTAQTLLIAIEKCIDKDSLTPPFKEMHYEKIAVEYLNQEMWDYARKCAGKISTNIDPIYSRLIDAYRNDFTMILACVKKMVQAPPSLLSIAQESIQQGFLGEAKELAARVDFNIGHASKIEFYALLGCNHILKDLLNPNEEDVSKTATLLITEIFSEKEEQRAVFQNIVLLLKNYPNIPVPADVKLKVPTKVANKFGEIVERYTKH